MIWWLIRVLFFAAFIVLEIRLSRTDNKWLGLIPPACFAVFAGGLYLLYADKVEFFGIAMDNVIAFSGLALLMLIIYFVIRFKGVETEEEVN